MFHMIMPAPQEPEDMSSALTMERLTQNPAYWRIMLASGERKTLGREMNRIRKLVDSPIEALLMCALSVVLSDGAIGLRLVRGRNLDILRKQPGNVLASQVPVGRHRVDLVLAHKRADGASFAIAIECDGAAFHRATAEQWQRDAERSAVLAPHFDGIIRFSGSSIFKDPMRCAERACGFLIGEIVSNRGSV